MTRGVEGRVGNEGGGWREGATLVCLNDLIVIALAVMCYNSDVVALLPLHTKSAHAIALTNPKP